MKIQPRQRLLEIWQATVRAAYAPSEHMWRWGGRLGPNSISDAEQLLCIMLPATEMPSFRLERPNDTNEAVLDSLRSLGGRIEVARVLVAAINDYLLRYQRADGTPTFAGSGAFVPREADQSPTEEQRDLDVVESYAVSVRLTLAALGFAKVLREAAVPAGTLPDELDRMAALAGRRLTAAIVGLLRSFVVNVFEADTDFGQTLLRTVNQTGSSTLSVSAALADELRETAARLQDLTIGVGHTYDLEVPGRLFECGWTWGVTKDAPVVPMVDESDIGFQPRGYAAATTHLYFTVVALDCIEELDSERVRLLSLLTDDQLTLARELRLRWELTQNYWATVASFGTGRWPVEDMPWRTVDGRESDYFTLLVTSIAARSLAERRGSDTDLGRLGSVLAELANRGRITRRPTWNDTALLVHTPGVALDLPGSELGTGPQLTWVTTDFAPLLLKRVLSIAELVSDVDVRRTLVDLADEVWDHVSRRRLTTAAGRDLWDQPAHVFAEVDHHSDEISWHLTFRVVESLVVAARMVAAPPPRSQALIELGLDLLAETEHLFDQELLGGAGEGAQPLRVAIRSLQLQLSQATEILESQPGTAIALMLEVLKGLERLATARDDARSTGF